MTSWTTKADTYQGDASPPDQRARNTVEALKEVTEEIKRLRKPAGDPKSPGRTCREIAATATEPLKNGVYWIDPNGGGVSDAIEVYCRFNQDRPDKTQTCLRPEKESYDKKTFSRRPSGDDVVLFADSLSEEEFSYKTHKSQVKYLHKLAKQGRQRITIQCRNVVTVYDSHNSTYEHAVRLTSFDEEEMSVQGNKAFRYKVVKDECKERNGKWGEAVIEVRGRSPRIERLPILDVGFKDVGGSEQEVGIAIGRACFSS